MSARSAAVLPWRSRSRGSAHVGPCCVALKPVGQVGRQIQAQSATLSCVLTPAVRVLQLSVITRGRLRRTSCVCVCFCVCCVVHALWSVAQTCLLVCLQTGVSINCAAHTRRQSSLEDVGKTHTSCVYTLLPIDSFLL